MMGKGKPKANGQHHQWNGLLEEGFRLHKGHVMKSSNKSGTPAVYEAKMPGAYYLHFAMKPVQHLNEYQQTLLSVLAIIDEAELIGILRALRHAPQRNEVIDLANAELDKGKRLMDMLAKGPLYALLANNPLQMRTCILRTGRISIDIGTRGEECGMGNWTFAVDGAGQVHSVECNGTWNEFHRGHPFSTTIFLS